MKRDDGIIEIKQARTGTLLRFAVGLVLAIACWIATRFVSGGFGEFAAWCGVVVFGIVAVLSLMRLVLVRGPVVTITARGIRDARLAAEEIPWNAVETLTVVPMMRQRLIVLKVDPAVEARLHLTGAARLSAGPNRAIGADGLCVATAGLAHDHDTLFDVCRSRWEVARTAGAKRRRKG